MRVGFFWLALAVSSVPLAACQLAGADAETYRRAVSPDVPFSERRGAFSHSLEVCPDNVSLHVEFSSFLVANRDFSGALLEVEKGLVLDPNNGVLNLRKGEALVALGQGKAALDAFDKTAKTGESQFFRGLAYQMLEDHRSAQQCFHDAWRLGNEDPYVLYSLMREDRELGDKAAGVEHFKLMLARFPESVWIHILLGDAHFEKGEESQAREEYLLAVKQSPDLFEPNFRLAYLTFEAGDNVAAEQYYRRALAAKPHHTEANVYLGEALRRERRLPEAIEQLRHAIEVDPGATLAYDSLAKAFSDAGRLPEAAELLLSAEKRFSDNSSFPAMRAHILKRLGRTQEAAQDSRRAQEIISQKNQRQALVHQ